MTDLLATVFGVYMLAGGFGLVVNTGWAERILEDFESSPAMSYLAGAIITLAGTALVLTHNIWSGWPDIMVTLIGWGAAIEGVIMLIAPQALLAFAKKLSPNKTFMRAFGLFTMMLGAALIGL